MYRENYRFTRRVADYSSKYIRGTKFGPYFLDATTPSAFAIMTHLRLSGIIREGKEEAMSHALASKVVVSTKKRSDDMLQKFRTCQVK